MSNIKNPVINSNSIKNVKRKKRGSRRKVQRVEGGRERNICAVVSKPEIPRPP